LFGCVPQPHDESKRWLISASSLRPLLSVSVTFGLVMLLLMVARVDQKKSLKRK